MRLIEAVQTPAKAVEGTNIDVNIDGEKVQIHWFGVAKIECQPATATKVITALRQLEQFGMKDC